MNNTFFINVSSNDFFKVINDNIHRLSLFKSIFYLIIIGFYENITIIRRCTNMFLYF